MGVDHHVQFWWILLVLSIAIYVAQAATIQTFYDVVEPGQSIEGTIAATYEINAMRCLHKYVELNECSVWMLGSKKRQNVKVFAKWLSLNSVNRNKIQK